MNQGNKPEGQDVFARALVYLYGCALKQIGIDAQLEAVKTHPEAQKAG